MARYRVLRPALRPARSRAADPFAGSPAETYAAGAAGILIPPAHPLPGYPAAQVARAYRITRQLLVAANLDATTLRGGSPDAFARLLVPRQQAFFVKQLDHMGLDRHGYARSTREWVASFAPGSTQFPGNVIKVNGMMSARVAQVQGSPVLRVHADYLFVYPVERPAQPSTLMRVVLQDQVNVDFANWANPRGGPLEAWWNLDGGGASGARCDVSDGFIHPAFPNGTPEKVQPSGRPIDPYRLSAPARVPGCQATTGT